MIAVAQCSDNLQPMAEEFLIFYQAGRKCVRHCQAMLYGLRLINIFRPGYLTSPCALFINRKMKIQIRRLCLCILFLTCSRPCLGAGKPLEPIRPAETLPQTTPWDLAALSRPPEFEWAEGDKIRSLYYRGLTYQGKPTRVFAYYATPGSVSGDASQDKNLPAIVLVHGGGGQAFSEWAELWARRGYAAIAMDLAGNGPQGKRLEDGGPDQSDATKFGNIASLAANQWTYHAVANVILAHSLLRSFAEVDAERTAITGISWGGYITCIVAGLDNRFQAAVPVYGCGFLDENSCWLGEFAKMSPENKAKWMQLWDPSRYVGSASMPMLFVNGGNDGAYPPDSHAKTYRLVQSAKNLRFSPDLPHGHIFDRPGEIEVFINHYLRGGTPLAKIYKPVVAEKKITARVEAETKLVSARLYYTTDPLGKLYPSEGLKPYFWQEIPAQFENGSIVADRPPREAVIWFITVTDERDLTVASEVAFE